MNITAIKPLHEQTSDALATARKATRVRLSHEMSGERLFEVLMLAIAADFAHNLNVFLKTGSAEAVKQTRVAGRRARVVISAFKPWCSANSLKSINRQVRYAMWLLHPVRQHDVVTNRPSVTGQDTSALVADRADMVAEAQQDLLECEAHRIAPVLSNMMMRQAWRGKKTKPLKQPCRTIIPVIIDAVLKRLWRHGNLEAVFADSADDHRFRKDLKRLRYVLDSIRALYPKPEIALWRKVVKRLQDALGTVNDLDEARMMGYEHLLISGGYGPRRDEAVSLLISLSQTLCLLPRFWGQDPRV
jgi:CHAD domain-containing protein